MPLPCVEPLPLYRPRDPRASALWRLMDQHFPTFQQVYDERYQFWHPHIHTLVTCGGFTPGGDFLEVHELDMDRLHAAWREVVENMRTWPHSGFSVNQSVFLPAGDLAGIQRLMQYMTRCPFSLSRLIKVTESGQVVYKAEKNACRAFPDPQRNDLATGPKRNFQILDPLDFIAEFTQHVPPKGSHLIRYYGWYSNKARGMRRKAAAAILPSPELESEAGGEGINDHSPTPRRASQTWAMLIKRVYEIDPLECPCAAAR